MLTPAPDPNGSFETGDLVPQAGWWRDQHGIVTYHDLHEEFPSCIGRKTERAVRRLIMVAPTT